MNIDGVTINVNVTGTDQLVRFFERLERIAYHAPPGIKRDIEAALEDMLRDMNRPQPAHNDYETKADP